MVTPYQPHLCAIIFRDDVDSGATIGYHCTIMRVHTSSISASPDRPNTWIYRVYVPYFDAHMDLAASDLFVTGGVDVFPLPPERGPVHPVCELRFDSHVFDDNNAIEGSYRFPGRQWRRFSFRKCDQLTPSFQLRLAVNGVEVGSGSLFYDVPTAQRLDRSYVLSALAEIVGVTNGAQTD